MQNVKQLKTNEFSNISIGMNAWNETWTNDDDSLGNWIR